MSFQGEIWPKVAITGGVIAGSYICYKLLSKPSRPFEGVDSVGEEYNKWTSDGILEHYWGEHIHLGFYKNRAWFNPSDWFITSFFKATKAGQRSQSFKDSKLEFTNELVTWSGVSDLPTSEHFRVLDVGCGIGGTSRMLAQSFKSWTITGVSISPEQVSRASQLAMEKGILNVDFRCCDAMNMPFPDNSFDVVWSCESAEHMPDKSAFIKECMRVLKPGGRLVVATWCQRDDRIKPFSKAEREKLDFLYKEWRHPAFASLEHYSELASGHGLVDIRAADWTQETLPAWRHSIFVGMWSPGAVLVKPPCWWSTIREIVTLERMHCAFRDGLMQYGILTGVKSS
jgi:MPBQ/MSBQ methyltransferase